MLTHHPSPHSSKRDDGLIEAISPMVLPVIMRTKLKNGHLAPMNDRSLSSKILLILVLINNSLTFMYFEEQVHIPFQWLS
jgi:hypothetical protein